MVISLRFLWRNFYAPETDSASFGCVRLFVRSFKTLPISAAVLNLFLTLCGTGEKAIKIPGTDPENGMDICSEEITKNACEDLISAGVLNISLFILLLNLQIRSGLLFSGRQHASLSGCRPCRQKT